MSERIRVVHVINSFAFGGAETMLCNLLLRTDTRRFDPCVVALINDMTLADPVLKSGIPLAVMGMKAGIPDPRGLTRLAKYLHRMKPAIVQTWMDHSNLIGGLAARAASRARVVWGIHHSEHVRDMTKRSTLLTVSACAKLSRVVPDKIVCCSQHSQKLYALAGFASERLLFIPNGFDTSLFCPDVNARDDIRVELGIPTQTVMIGLVARYDPVKDHGTFLNAAAVLHKLMPDVHFLLCGRGVDGQNAALTSEISRLGLTERCHLLGPRRDVARIHASLDVVVSSSVSEAFPLVLGEAMACGVPCVATDVGDSAYIIGPTGYIVPPRDPSAMAAAVLRLLELAPAEKHELGASARRRICALFDLGAVTRQYENVYEELLKGNPRFKVLDTTRAIQTSATSAI